MAVSASPDQEEAQPERAPLLRNRLAAAVRSVNWSYAIFWSISSTHPGALTWTDGFYNGEVKTRKVANPASLTAAQQVMQRSEQLRELYESLLSGACDRRAARPVASLSPEDLADAEWYYVVCMTYAFRPGQGLPGRSSASNQHVWLRNAHLADSKAFLRALLAKSASIQTIACIPLMGGVLEMGTTDSIAENPDLVSRATTSFLEPQFPACMEDPISSSPSANETGEAADTDIVVFEDLDRNAMETMVAGARELAGGEAGESGLADASLEHMAKEIDEFYTLFDELDVLPLEEDGSWIMDGAFEVPSPPPQPPPPPGATTNAAASSGTPVDGYRATSFTVWTRADLAESDEVGVPVVEQSQKLLKKVVAGGAWTNNEAGGDGGGGGGTARTQQEGGIKNHVMSERRRREKLNEMFLVLKSLVPSIHKVDKASILAETIAYLKELERRVQELKSSRQLISPPTETTRPPRRHGCNSVTVRNKKVSAGTKRKRSEAELAGGDAEREEEHGEQHLAALAKDGSSNVTVTVTGKDVLLEVQCRWEELLMTRVFDAIKNLRLDVLSIQASAPDGFMGLKIRAQFASCAAVVPSQISEALRKAIGKR